MPLALGIEFLGQMLLGGSYEESCFRGECVAQGSITISVDVCAKE
jgi:hypothetical protein